MLALATALLFTTMSGPVATAALTAPGLLLARDDLCTSPEFREAFLEGQLGVIIDYTSPSPNLVALGNRVLPCLVAIAEHGGDVFGIDTCIEGSHGCHGWALTSIRLIGTPEARQYLISNLAAGKERDLVWMSIRAVGSLRDPRARPSLRKLLEHEDPEIRTASLVSLAAIGDRSDLGAMLETAIALPDEQIRAAAPGFRILDDPRAFEPLEARIAGINDPEMKRWAEKVLTDWRSRIAEEVGILTVLRLGSEGTLYKTIQKLRIQSDALRAALFELLESEDARARAESVKALARYNMVSDFDRLLEVTLGRPSRYIVIGAQGMEHFNDPRAIEPLGKYAIGMRRSRAQKRELITIIKRIRRRTSP